MSHVSSEETQDQNNIRDTKYVGGFYLTSEAHHAVSNFVPLHLRNGWTFWHSSRGLLQTTNDDGNQELVLFGTFFHLNEENNKIAAERLLRAYISGEEEFECEFDNFVGRFVLLINSPTECCVFNDALGTRSIYYAVDQQAVSSHYNLLATKLGEAPVRTWQESRMAMDLTKSSQINQLLPNFKLDCLKSESSRFFPVQANEFSTWSHNDKQTEITRLWTASLDRLLNGTNQVVFSISGGLDSRLSVAMAHEYWENLNLYTYGTKVPKDTKYSQVMNRDYVIAHELIEIIRPKNYKFIHLAENRKLQPALATLLKTNSLTQHGPSLVQRYREEFPGDDWIHVRSNGIEVARGYFGFKDSVESIIKTCQNDGAIDFHSRLEILGYGSPQHGYNRRDLFYWEIRMGKWHSEVLNETDAAFETILPHNSRRIIKLLLSYSPEQRKSSFAIKELMNRNAPILNFFGINDERNLYEIVRDERPRNTNASNIPRPLTSAALIKQTTKILISRGLKKVKNLIRRNHTRNSKYAK